MCVISFLFLKPREEGMKSKYLGWEGVGDKSFVMFYNYTEEVFRLQPLLGFQRQT